MSKRRTSAIWKIQKIELEKIVKENRSYKPILAAFGLENKGENFRTLQKKLLEDCIDFSHLYKHGENKECIKRKELSTILVVDSDFNRGHLKQRLLKAGLLRNECYECAQLPIWNGKPLVLQIDHINGISNDNRIENLRMLCPHCHSQTTTFAGRKLKK